MADMICVRKFEELEDAESARKRLSARGIDAMIETAEEGKSGAGGAAKLMVREEETRRAIEALNIQKGNGKKACAA